MDLKRSLFSILITLALANPAAAWDPAGHEQIADIAWTHLSSPAKARLATILAAGDVHFRPENASEAAARRAFRRVATFPDDGKTIVCGKTPGARPAPTCSITRHTKCSQSASRRGSRVRRNPGRS